MMTPHKRLERQRCGASLNRNVRPRMKCPLCSARVSIFSRDLNRWGNRPRCPKCGGAVRVGLNGARSAMLFVPAVVLAIYLKPLFVWAGVPGSLAVVLSVLLLVGLSLQILSAQTKTLKG